MDAETKELIKSLIPFNQMSDADLDAVLGQSQVLEMPKGKMVFKRAEEDDKVYWLISGDIDLLDEKFEAKPRKAGEDATRNAIDPNSPHRLTAVTTSDARVLACDRSTMAIHMGGGGGQATASTVDVGEGIDWMSTLLSSPLFEFIPPANIQTLFSKFEEVTYEAGTTVITQGETGDYFYVIQAGRAKVERSAADKTVVLAELKPGDNFGQDALVSDTPRNATVTMTTNGTLMRLSEPDFQSLLMSPVIETVSMDDVQEMINQGEPKTYIIDVRTPAEVEEDKIPGSLNVPLQLLRKNMSKLKEDAVYCVICDGGKRSALGAYQLNEEGYAAYVIKAKLTQDMKKTAADQLIEQFDTALRTLAGVLPASRENPADTVPESELSDADRQLAGRLMRVNHCGEICAQALYLGQGLTSSNPQTRQAMQDAADEEADHLAWCETRLNELDTHKSYLNPVFWVSVLPAVQCQGLSATGLTSGSSPRRRSRWSPPRQTP